MTTDPGDLVLDATCFRAGTLVKAERGWRLIESIRPGERVWTYAGRLQRVVGVQARPHTGRMVGLRVSSPPAPLSAASGGGFEERLSPAAQTSPPFPLSTSWRGGQEETLPPGVPASPPDPLSACGEGEPPMVWCTVEHKFLTLVPPLDTVERQPGGKAVVERRPGAEAVTRAADRALHPPSPRAERGPGGEANAQTPQNPAHVPPLHPVERGLGGEASHAAIHASLGGVAPHLVPLARELRHSDTSAEDRLWQHLRGRRLRGARFRRQHPLGANYIADFYCPEARLAVELDGSVHGSRWAKWADGVRHRQLQEAGVRVLRFRNEQVIHHLESVLAEIAAHLTPQPTLHSVERPPGGEAGAAHRVPHPPSPPAERGLGGEDNCGTPRSLLPPLHAVERGPGGEAQAFATHWRPAASLRPGDCVVIDELGHVSKIAEVQFTHSQETVFDLTVAIDHSFITQAGVAHNCGSGATAYVAEQWGRRWITIDVSRVPLALAWQRLLTATIPWYELKDEARGPAGRFIYKRKQNRKGEEIGGIVPHVTLKSIANNEPPQEEVRRPAACDIPFEFRGFTLCKPHRSARHSCL